MPGTVADVKHLHDLLFLKDPVDHSINVRLVAVKQMPNLIIFQSRRASKWNLAKAEDCICEPLEPCVCRVGMLGVDFVE
jgi:hypothetical protein